MSANRKPIHQYPKFEASEADKYLPSIFFDVQIYNEILKVEARPLVKDRGYFTINISGIFLAHIRKLDKTWIDFIGESNEKYQIIGTLIDEHTKI